MAWSSGKKCSAEEKNLAADADGGIGGAGSQDEQGDGEDGDEQIDFRG